MEDVAVQYTLLQFLDVSLLIMVAVIYGLGMFIKASGIKDKYIPLILLVLAVVLTIAYMAFIQGLGFNPTVIINGFIQGVIVACIAVYGNQAIKQLGKKE